MFDEVRRAVRELLHGNASPEERRSALAEMKETLVMARMGLDDLRTSVATTRKRLDQERAELETILRRKVLAQGINDAETVGVAERFERQHLDKVSVLERKLEALEAEVQMTEREVGEMTAEYKAAMAGVPIGAAGKGAGAAGPGATLGTAEDPLAADDQKLRGELDRLERERRRAAADADADERLAALKRRMGR